MLLHLTRTRCNAFMQQHKNKHRSQTLQANKQTKQSTEEQQTGNNKQVNEHYLEKGLNKKNNYASLIISFKRTGNRRLIQMTKLKTWYDERSGTESIVSIHNKTRLIEKQGEIPRCKIRYKNVENKDKRVISLAEWEKLIGKQCKEKIKYKIHRHYIMKNNIKKDRFTS